MAETEVKTIIKIETGEFETATVAKKIGLGFTKAPRGDFNDDYNNN